MYVREYKRVFEVNEFTLCQLAFCHEKMKRIINDNNCLL